LLYNGDDGDIHFFRSFSEFFIAFLRLFQLWGMPGGRKKAQSAGSSLRPFVSRKFENPSYFFIGSIIPATEKFSFLLNDTTLHRRSC
jgi:hypothetical protein